MTTKHKKENERKMKKRKKILRKNKKMNEN